MSQKLVVVVGATGTQGGSVVSALLRHGGYAIRGITRNADGESAKALKNKGVEVVSARLIDKDSLIKAFRGAYAVFGVTVPFTEDDEELQGRNIVDAAKAAKVPLLVWSSLPSASETSNGKYTTIYHFDKKNAVDKYIATAGQPSVILHTGGFAENLFQFKQLQRDESNPNKWNIIYPVVRPETPMPMTWIEGDFGNIVVAVIDHWEDDSFKAKLTKERIVAAPITITGNEMVETIKKVTGKEVTYVRKTDVQEFEKAVFGWADEGYYDYKSQSRILEELGVKTHTFEDFVRAKVVPYMESAQ